MKYCAIFLSAIIFLISLLTGFIDQALAEVFVINKDIQIEVIDSSIILRTSAPIKPTQLDLLHPPRSVLDLPQIKIEKDQVLPIKDSRYFKSIRLGRHEDFTRVVVDLKNSTHQPSISTEQNVINLNFGGAAVPMAGATSAPAITPTHAPEIVPAIPVTIVAKVSPTPAITLKVSPLPTTFAAPSIISAHSILHPTATVAILTPTTTPTETHTSTPTTTPTGAPVETLAPILTSTPTLTTNPTVTMVPAESPTLLPLHGPVPIVQKNTVPQNADQIEVALKFSVNVLEVAFLPGERPVKDLVVKNKSDKPLFMTASVDKIIDAGTSNETKSPTNELLASPRRFQLESGQERSVRLVLADKNSAENERVYRVNLIPDAEPFETQQLSRTDLSIATGLSILATTEPLNPKANLIYSWKNDLLTISNIGNANLLLDHGQVCAGAACTPLPSRRLYPGNSWEIPVKQFSSVQFLQRSGEDFKQVLFNRE